MRRIIKAIPNSLTLSNLICGCLATYFAAHNSFTYAFWLIILAAVFDFFDGFAARMLKAHSPIGADLDSLADMVSFGMAPAIATLVFIQSLTQDSTPLSYLAYGALLLAVFAALRLAKFNNDPSQSNEFKGVPTPAMALFFMSFVMIESSSLGLSSQTLGYVALVLVSVFCALMVCNIPMFSFKFRSFSIGKNLLQYIFILFTLAAVVLLRELAPTVIIITYIIVSIVRWQAIKNRRTV